MDRRGVVQRSSSLAGAPTRPRSRPKAIAPTLMLVIGLGLADSVHASESLSTTAMQDPMAELGRQVFFDKSLSEPAGTSCASCHDPKRAFSGDNGSGLGVPRGSRPDALGFRDAPTLMYLAKAPAFGWVEDGDEVVPVGGMFWDGRADTFESQARGPLFAAHEMNNADVPSLARKLAAAPYAPQIGALFGSDALTDPERTVSAALSGLGALQRSEVFQPFTSKFDAAKRGQTTLTEQEERGFAAFSIGQKGNCHECHTVDIDSKDPADSLFTNFRFHALGVPRNMTLPATQDPGYQDRGLCDALRDRGGVEQVDRYCGFFKAPTLRNIALSGPYMHNGHFKSLRDAVAFYATRDTNPELWYPGGDKFNDLPQAMRSNIDLKKRPYHRKIGKRPALNDEEVDDIVAFLHTLTDGWQPPPQAATSQSK